MKRIFFAAVTLVFCLTGFSQTISQITITGNGQVDIIAFGLDENVQVYITKDGIISKWGFDRFIGYQENYRGELDPYAGRVEYYAQNDDESVRGKVKYIGRTLLTYFTSYERESLKGKLKSIGSLNIDYYLPVDDKAMAGNLKAIGQKSITWYASYENEALRGKLKTVGPATLTYYGPFEDKAFKGKIKSIDRFNIIYYSSVEQFSGSIKNGQHILNANGIKYYLRNY